MAPEESKGVFKLQYGSILESLRVEKIEHPETYPGAVRIVEKVRETCIKFTGADDFPPVPKD